MRGAAPFTAAECLYTRGPDVVPLLLLWEMNNSTVFNRRTEELVLVRVETKAAALRSGRALIHQQLHHDWISLCFSLGHGHYYETNIKKLK